MKEYARIRSIKEVVESPVYGKWPSVGTYSKVYKSRIETVLRGFIKACLCADPSQYGLSAKAFSCVDDLIEFVAGGYAGLGGHKITRGSVYMLKKRSTIIKTVPRSSENEAFVEYVKKSFPDFRDDLLFRD